MPTVEANDAYESYIGNGSLAVYPYTFKVFAKEDIGVYVDSVLKGLDTDYTVSGIEVSSGGNITFTTPPATNAIIVIVRNQPLSQLSVYLPNDGLPAHIADRIEDDFDKSTMADQMLQDAINASLHFVKGSDHRNVIVEDPVAGQALFWDATGERVTSGNVTVDIEAFASSTIANLGSASPAGMVKVLSDGIVAGTPVVSDGSDWHCWDYHAKSEINVGCPPWNADPDLADNTVAIQAALDVMNEKNTAIGATGLGKFYHIYLPGGVFTVTSLLYSANVFTAFIMRSIPGSRLGSLEFAGDGVNDYGLRIFGNQVGQSNHLSISDMSLFTDRGVNKPSKVLDVFNFVQIRIDNVGVGNHVDSGLYFEKITHAEIARGTCLAGDDATDRNTACIRLREAQNTRITGWDTEDNTGTPFPYFLGIGAGSSGVMRDIIVSENKAVSPSGGLLTVYEGAGEMTGIKIVNNTWIGMTGHGIDWLTGGSTAAPGNVISGNNFQHIGDPTGNSCIRIDRGNVDVHDNYCSGFDIGIFSTRNVGAIYFNNQLENIVTDCVQLDGDENTVVFGTRITGAFGGNLVYFDPPSAGANVVSAFIFIDAAAKALGYVLDDAAAVSTDRVRFADSTQEIVIADDTVGAQVATGTITPHYSHILVDCNDPDGCDTTLDTTKTREGMELTVRLAANPGTTNRILTPTPVAITEHQIRGFEFHNGEWRPVG